MERYIYLSVLEYKMCFITIIHGKISKQIFQVGEVNNLYRRFPCGNVY